LPLISLFQVLTLYLGDNTPIGATVEAVATHTAPSLAVAPPAIAHYAKYATNLGTLPSTATQGLITPTQVTTLSRCRHISLLQHPLQIQIGTLTRVLPIT